MGNMKAIHELLVNYWGLKEPDLIISITDGDVTKLTTNSELLGDLNKFLFTSLESKEMTWIITEGIHSQDGISSAEYIGKFIKYHEKELRDRVRLISIAKWEEVAGVDRMYGPHVGRKRVIYPNPKDQGIEGYSLEQNHDVFLLCDMTTSISEKREPFLRNKLEQYLMYDKNIDVVVLLLGGYESILKKLSQAKMIVVAGAGSGNIADCISSAYKELENVKSRKLEDSEPLNEDELKKLETYLESVPTKEGKESLQLLMSRRSVITVLHQENENVTRSGPQSMLWSLNNSHKVELETFPEQPDGEEAEKTASRDYLKTAITRSEELRKQHTREHIANAMKDNPERANDIIEHEKSRDKEEGEEYFLEALMVALEKNIPSFIEMLFKYNSFDNIPVGWLEQLYLDTMSDAGLMPKILNKLSWADTEIKRETVLPLVGKLLSKLLGNNYRLLYQEEGLTKSDMLIKSTSDMTPVWHLYIWAVLSNKKDLALEFLVHTECTIGNALIGCKLFKGLANFAETLREMEEADSLKHNTSHFQKLAMEVLGNLYSRDRHAAYRNLISRMSLNLGKYTTPLSIAYDANAKDFIGHTCCQTLLRLIWRNCIPLDTAWYKWLCGPFNCICMKKMDDEIYQLAEKVADKDGKQTSEQETGLSNKTFQPVPRNTRIKMKRYFNAPITKFFHSFVSYCLFLGIFTNFMLTDLKPINSASEITVCEWLTYVWFFAIASQEAKQIYDQKISGPLYHVEKVNHQVWKWHEHLRFYHLEIWLRNFWNRLDALLILLFLVCILVRASLSRLDFEVVRIFFCITLILSYCRILQFGFVQQKLGPRIFSIGIMLKDLVYFLLILLVFMVSFGVAFQSLLDPNRSPSWESLRHVMWRPYWQMLGELFLDDLTEGMGLEVPPRNCTYDRTLARSQPEIYKICHEWILPVLLGIFMMITNILLLNLLIAIFSKSFDKVEEEAAKVWHYHLYALYVENYNLSWLPPPLNLPWYCFLALKKLVLMWQSRFENKNVSNQGNQNSSWLCCSNKIKPLLEDNSQAAKGRAESQHKVSTLPNNLFCLGTEYRNQKLETEAVKEVNFDNFKASETKSYHLDKKIDAMQEDLHKLKSALIPDMEKI